MSELKPLKFNIECLDFNQSGGFEPENDWWMIVLVVLVVILIISIVVSKSNSNSNANSTSVHVTKRSIDGEDVYYKEVDGDEQELTEEEKKNYDKMFEEKIIADDEDVVVDAEAELNTEDIIINDPSYID